MKLEKAQEIASLNIKEAGKTMPPDVLTMIKMAESAFSQILTFRKEHDLPHAFHLKGETSS